MQEGQEGLVYGRKARLVKVFSHCIRVLYLEGDGRYKLLEALFVPFEANVPASAWTTRR
jgi:hypothetical protein